MTTGTSTKTYNRQQLCEALGLSESNFDRCRVRLEEGAFPARLPGLARWSRATVDAWIAANGDTDLMRAILVGPEPAARENLTTVPESVLERYTGAAA